LQLLEAVADNFWKKWLELYVPSMVRQGKWIKGGSEVKVGDVVLVADSNCLRGQYRMARVKEVFPSADGRVRKVSVVYRNFRVGGKLNVYRSGAEVTVMRSVHRLAVLDPVGDGGLPSC
jgi:hypothetical protein